jgi:hypothetical protein
MDDLIAEFLATHGATVVAAGVSGRERGPSEAASAAAQDFAHCGDLDAARYVLANGLEGE